MLAGCGGGGASGHSAADIKTQCRAYTEVWRGPSERDRPAEAERKRAISEKVTTECCSRMAAAAKKLNAKERDYLWWDLQSNMGKWDSDADRKTALEMVAKYEQQIKGGASSEALKPRTSIYASCVREIEGDTAGY